MAKKVDTPEPQSRRVKQAARKAEKGGRAPKHHVDDADEEAQKKKDRMTLIVFFTLAVLIVIGMFLLSKFISGN